jgi:hypothetical protein
VRFTGSNAYRLHQQQPFFCSGEICGTASNDIKTKGNGRYRVNGKSKALIATGVFLKRWHWEQQEEFLVMFT